QKRKQNHSEDNPSCNYFHFVVFTFYLVQDYYSRKQCFGRLYFTRSNPSSNYITPCRSRRISKNRNRECDKAWWLVPCAYFHDPSSNWHLFFYYSKSYG